MKAAKRTWLALVLASSLAMGENAPAAAERAAREPSPASTSATASPLPPDRVTDLDFSDDFPASTRADAPGGPVNPAGQVTRKSPSADYAAAPEPARAWIYWTLGFTGLAAGGAAWYLHWDGSTAPDPVRKDQVFTDDPD